MDISTALGVVQQVLQFNHPSSDVRIGQSGNCDIRVDCDSDNSSISVTTYNGVEFTDDDYDGIKNIEIIPGKSVEHNRSRTDTADENCIWFDLVDE